jgi:hypothetical protein
MFFIYYPRRRDVKENNWVSEQSSSLFQIISIFYSHHLSLSACVFPSIHPSTIHSIPFHSLTTLQQQPNQTKSPSISHHHHHFLHSKKSHRRERELSLMAILLSYYTFYLLLDIYLPYRHERECILFLSGGIVSSLIVIYSLSSKPHDQTNSNHDSLAGTIHTLSIARFNLSH